MLYKDNKMLFFLYNLIAILKIFLDTRIKIGLARLLLIHKYMKNTLKTLILTAFLVLGFSLTTSPAWSAIELVKPSDSSVEISKVDIKVEAPAKSQSHAPEPGTLALFGGGVLSMLITFVRRTYLITKRVIDVAGSIIALILLSPVLLIVAILIKVTSKGPIFYSQVRVGKDGKSFDIYKFRSMRTDAETASGPVWAAKNDSRITPIGSFIRKSRIDEIPQFINVLKGDMSIIGPRPERPIFVEKLKKEIADYEKRLNVKPGITGLAQVWHHYDESIADVRKKIKYDILYIKNVCLWTDLRILWRTVRVVLTGAGAK